MQHCNLSRKVHGVTDDQQNCRQYFFSFGILWFSILIGCRFGAHRERPRVDGINLTKYASFTSLRVPILVSLVVTYSTALVDGYSRILFALKARYNIYLAQPLNKIVNVKYKK